MGERLQIIKEERELSLDVLARYSAQRMLAVALEEEVTATTKRCAHLKDDSGHRLAVRSSKAKTRKVTSGRAGRSKSMPPWLAIGERA